MFKIKLSDMIVSKHVDSLKPKLLSKIDDIIHRIEGADNQTEFDRYECLFMQSLSDANNPLYVECILVAKPHELMNIYALMRKNFNFITATGNYLFQEDGCIIDYNEDADKEKIDRFLNDIKRVFDYNSFIIKGKKESWNAYIFTKETGVTVCPYCNRQYVQTITRINNENKTEFVMRPEIDHYFEKSRYPFFALSIYNLIPCCHYCNSVIKHTRKLNLDDYIHPYCIDDTDRGSEFFFRYEFLNYDKAVPGWNERNVSQKIKNTLDFFEIKEIYAEHSDLVNQMITVARNYDKSYIKELLTYYKGPTYSVTLSSLIRAIFSSYMVEDEDHEVLGKLKKDILQRIVKSAYGIDILL